MSESELPLRERLMVALLGALVEGDPILEVSIGVRTLIIEWEL